MSDIDEFERRIAAAMDRIADGVANLGPGGGDDATQTALEEERLANAQLQERVRKLTEKADAAQAQAQEMAQAATDRMQALDLELQRLRKATEQLRESNAALRAANEEGVGDAHLINKAMLAELEALRAARAADVAEAQTILASLDVLMSAPEDAHA